MYKVENNKHYFAMLEDKTIVSEKREKGKYKDIAPKPVNFIIAKLSNDYGSGIFFTIQETESGSRKIDDITAIRCWAVDLDNGTKEELMELINQSPLKPSLIVETKNGYHVYFYANKRIPITEENRSEMIERYKAVVQDRLVPFFRLKDENGELIIRDNKAVGADNNAKDLARMLRVPNFYHCKDINDRFLVRIVEENDSCYSEKQMLESFPLGKVEELKNEETPVEYYSSSLQYEYPTYTTYALSKFDCRKGLEKLSGTEAVKYEKYTFQSNGNNTEQIIVNGTKRSCWITREGLIGSHDNGGPTLYQWLKYYNYGLVDITKIANGYLGISKNPSQQDIANLIIQDNPIIFDCDLFYIYLPDKGIWKGVSLEWIGKRIIKLYNNFGQSPTSVAVDNIKKFMKNYLIPDFSMGETILNPNKDVLVLKNTTLNLSNFEIKPFSKDMYSTIGVGYDYDPDAKCPMWDKFISEVLPNKELQLLIQEVSGYCMTTDTKYHKAFFLLGGGRNGKSTFLEILRKLVGDSNCSSVDIANFEKDHGLTPMLHKLINIGADIGIKHLNDTGNFKKIVGGDEVEINPKNKSQFSTKLFCKLIYAVNGLPTSSDKTFGFYSKFIILPFEQQFTDEIGNQDKDLSSKLKSELSGIFNWAIEGLKRLREQGGFTNSQKAKEVLREYEVDSNSILAFIEETLEEDKEKYVVASVLYKDYLEYCKDNGYKICSSKKVGMELKKLPNFKRFKISNELRYYGFKYKGH